MSIQAGQTLDRDTLNRAYVSKTATGTQIMAGSLRLLGGIQIDGATTLGSVTTGAINAGSSSITTTGTISGTFSGNGASITSLNGSNISSGTVADARLSTNVMLLNKAQTVTASNTYSSAANLYFAGGTTYYVNTSGNAKFNSLEATSTITATGNQVKFLDAHSDSKLLLWSNGAEAIGTESYYLRLGATDAYNGGSIGTKIYRGAGELIAQFGIGQASITATNRLDSTFYGNVTLNQNLEIQGEFKSGGANEFPDPLVASGATTVWTSNWSGRGTLTVDTVQSPPATGAVGSIKIVSNAADAWAFYDYYFDVNPSEWITWSLYAFATASGQSAQIMIEWRDASKTILTTDAISFTMATAWTRYSMTKQAPSTARYFRVRMDNDTSGATMYFSAFQVERGMALTKFKSYIGGKDASLLYNNGTAQFRSGGTYLSINDNSKIVYLGGSNATASIEGTASIVTLNVSGNTTLTGTTTATGKITANGGIDIKNGGSATGTITLTDAILSWSRDTDWAKISYIDYGADNDQLTIDIGDRNTDYLRIRGADASSNLQNIIDFSQGGHTSYVPMTVSQSTNTAALILSGASVGWASGMLFNNTTTSTGRKYGFYSGSDGRFVLTDETAAAARLDVSSAGQIRIYNNAQIDGSLGMGTSSPSQKLHMYGTGQTLLIEQNSSVAGNSTIKMTTAGSANWAEIDINGGHIYRRTDGGNVVYVGTDTTTANSTIAIDYGNKRVGFGGKTTPGEVIDATGNIKASGNLYASHLYLNQTAGSEGNIYNLDGLYGYNDIRFGVGSTIYHYMNGTGLSLGKTTTPVYTLDVNGDVASNDNIFFSGIGGTHREGGAINLASRMNGRILNRNSDFIQNNTSSYAVYDNNASGRTIISIVSDDTIPNSTGKLMRVSYDPARNASKTTTPGFGGFLLSVSRTTGNPTDWGYRAGNRYIVRMVANIPSGRTLNWATNSIGTETSSKWLTSATGTGNWQEYVMELTIGVTGTFSSTGFWYISGGTDAAFAWDVAICQMIGIDEVPDVDRAPNLNVGYKPNLDLGWGQIYSTGSITSDSSLNGASLSVSGTVAGNKVDLSSGANWYMVDLGTQGAASSEHYGIGLTNGTNTARQMSFHVPNLTTGYSGTGTVPSFGWFSSGGTKLMQLDSGTGDLWMKGSFTIAKTGNYSTINFPAQTNDPGFIRHYESTNVSYMQFATGDDNIDTDYFSFGYGNFTETARITAAGNATFKGLTVNGNATITGTTTMNGWLTLDGGSGDGINIGGSKIQGVGTGELVVLADEFRLGTTNAAWDYNKWAGFRYDSAIATLSIGGPAAGATLWHQNTSPPRITLALVGTDAITMDGKVTINPVNSASIGLTTMANGHLLLGTTTSGMALDPNEIMVTGNPFYIGTIDSNSINITPNGTTRLAVSTSGITVTGTASVSGTSTLTGLVTASSGINAPAGQSLYIGTNGSSTASFRMHYNGTDSYLDYNTDLHFRAGVTDKVIIKASGSVGIGTVSPNYLLTVAGDIYANGGWLRSAGSTGWYNETYSGGWYMTDTTWIRNYGSKQLYVNALTRSDSLQIGSTTTYTAANDFQWSGGVLNHRNTLWANNVGVAVGKTSLSNAAILDVYTTSASGINLQRSAQTIAPGITFQNSDGVYTSWIAPTASASPDIVFYTEGNSTTLSTANIKETMRLTNTGNMQLTGDLVFSGSGTSAIRKVNSISFDWTGTYDYVDNHGITSKAEDGTLSDKLRINSYADIILTIDTNANSTAKFIVQKESTTNGTDLLTVDESGNTIITGTLQVKGASIQFNDNNGPNIIYTDSNSLTQTGFYDTADGFTFQSDLTIGDTVVKAGNFHATETVYSDQGMGTGKFKMVYNATEDSLDFTYVG